MELDDGVWWDGTLIKPYGMPKRMPLNSYKHSHFKKFLLYFHSVSSCFFPLNENCHATLHLDSVAMVYLFFSYFVALLLPSHAC